MMDVDEVYTLEKRITKDFSETENLSAIKKKKKKKKKKDKITKDSSEKGNNEAIKGKEDLENKCIQKTEIDNPSEELGHEKSLHPELETVGSSQEIVPSDSDCKSKSDYAKHTVFNRNVMDRNSELDEPKSSDEELAIDAASLSCALEVDTLSYFSSVLSGCARTRGSTIPLLNEHSKDTVDALTDGASTQEFVTASVSFENSEATEDESSVMQDGCARTRGSKTSMNELLSESNVLACETDEPNSNGNGDNNEDKRTNSQGKFSLENISKDFSSIEGSSARTRGSRKSSLCETNTVTNCSDAKTFQTKPSLTEVSVLKDGQKISTNFTSESNRGPVGSNSSVPTAGPANATCLAVAFSNQFNIREIQDRNLVESRRIIDSQDNNQNEDSKNKLEKSSIDEQNGDVCGSETVSEVKVVCKPDFMNAIHSEEHQNVPNIPLSIEDDKQSLTTSKVQYLTTSVVSPKGKKSEITTDAVSTKTNTIISQQVDVLLETVRSRISDAVVGDDEETAISSQSIAKIENDFSDKADYFRPEKCDWCIAKDNQASYATNFSSKQCKEIANEGGPSNIKIITDSFEEMKSVDTQCSRMCEFDTPEVETTVTTTTAAGSENECSEPQQKLHFVDCDSSESFHNEHYMCQTEQKVFPPKNSKSENVLSGRDVWKVKETPKLQLTDDNTLNKGEHDITFNKASDRAESKGEQEAAPGEVTGCYLAHTVEDSQKNVRSNYTKARESCKEMYLESITTTGETKNIEHITESSIFYGEENSRSKKNSFLQIKTKKECDKCTPWHSIEEYSVFGSLESQNKELQEHGAEVVTRSPGPEKKNTFCKGSDINNESILGSCKERTDFKTLDSSFYKATVWNEAKNVSSFTTVCARNEINVKSSNKIDLNMKDKSLLSNRKQIDPSGEPGREKEEGEITSSDEEATVASKSDTVEGKSSSDEEATVAFKSDTVEGKSDCLMQSNISNAKVMQSKEEKEEGELSSSEEEDSPDNKQEETKVRIPKDEKVAQWNSGKRSKISSLSAISRACRDSTGKEIEVRTHFSRDKTLVKHAARQVKNEKKIVHSSSIAARGQEMKSKKGRRGKNENGIQRQGPRLKTDKKPKIAINSPENATTAKHTDLRDLLTSKRVKDKHKLFSGETRNVTDFSSTSSKREVEKGSHNARDRVGKNSVSDEKRRALTSNVKGDKQLSKNSVAGSHRLGNRSHKNKISKDNVMKQPATSCELKKQKDKDVKNDCNERNLDNLGKVDKRKTKTVTERRNRRDKDSKKIIHNKRQLRSPNGKSKSQERKRSISVSPERKGKKRLQSNNENDKPLKRQRLSCANEIGSKRSKNCSSAQLRKETVLLTNKNIGSSDLKMTRHELLNKSSKFERQMDSDSKRCEGQSSTKEKNSSFEKDIKLKCSTVLDNVRKNESFKEVKKRTKNFQVKEDVKSVKGCSQHESRPKTSNKSNKSTDQYYSKHKNQQTFAEEEKKDRNNLLRSRENSRDLDNRSELNKKLITGQYVAVRSKEKVSVTPSTDGNFSVMKAGATYRNRAQTTSKDLDSGGPSSKSETSPSSRKAVSNTNTTIWKNRSASKSSAERETLQSSRLPTKNERPKYMTQRISANKAVKPSIEEQTIGSKSKAETAALEGRTLMTSRNKYLVFKRRHVNQLFVRGDNVVMVGYAR